ncbi:MAG: hypothetical protein F2542_03895, partial [Actinobacteria bacterium]|nr:hypothetical protein [Actinomycetota bacterium]
MTTRKIWRGFASDNYAGVHPAVFEAMIAVNDGHEIAYGEDTETVKFDQVVIENFGPKA